MISGRVVTAKDPCPHGSTLGKCEDIWCRSRMEDLERPEYRTGEFVAPPLTDKE